MNDRVLFVDDESQILDGIRRNLRKSFTITTAIGPEEGLEIIKNSSEPFAVIVSDMRMPVMDGVEFLKRTKQLSPDSVRIMLTGNADQGTAASAVNKGEVFKFLNKPCDNQVLEHAVQLGFRQYQLVTAEKELLDNTVKGSIEVLVDILSMAKPLAFGRMKRLRDLCRQLIEHMQVEVSWEIDTAVMLSQLGCINIADSILEKIAVGTHLQAKELEEYEKHPQLAFSLIKRIPRLDNVAKIVEYQHKNFDSTGLPASDIYGEAIPFGARVLRIVLEFDDRKSAGLSNNQIFEHFKKNDFWFDPKILSALRELKEKEKSDDVFVLPIEQLKVGMIVDEDVRNDKNILLFSRGAELTPVSLDHLRSLKRKGTLTKDIKVRGVKLPKNP